MPRNQRRRGWAVANVKELCMPVILPPEAQRAGLDDSVQDSEKLKALLRSYPADQMMVSPVSKAVNSPRNNGPKLIVTAPALTAPAAPASFFTAESVARAAAESAAPEPPPQQASRRAVPGTAE